MLISRPSNASRSWTLPYRTHWPLAPLRKATSSSDAQLGVWGCISRLYHGCTDVLPSPCGRPRDAGRLSADRIPGVRRCAGHSAGWYAAARSWRCCMRRIKPSAAPSSRPAIRWASSPMRRSISSGRRRWRRSSPGRGWWPSPDIGEHPANELAGRAQLPGAGSDPRRRPSSWGASSSRTPSSGRAPTRCPNSSCCVEGYLASL